MLMLYVMTMTCLMEPVYHVMLGSNSTGGNVWRMNRFMVMITVLSGWIIFVLSAPMGHFCRLLVCVSWWTCYAKLMMREMELVLLAILLSSCKELNVWRTKVLLLKIRSVVSSRRVYV